MLDEVYESPAGVVRHWESSAANWRDLCPVFEWTGKTKEQQVMHCGTVVQSLW